MKRKIRITGGLFLALVFAAFCPIAWAIGFSAEDVYESVFVIETDRAIGSGFAVSEKEIITNAHVISDAQRIRIITYGGNELPANVVAYDENLDLAILYVEEGAFSPLPLDSLDAIRVGDDVYAIGAPKSMAYTLTKGIISSKDRIIRGQQYIQIDAPVNEGNSGGPLLDSNGNVLGVITLKLIDAEGIGMAIPITVVSEWMSGVETSPPVSPGSTSSTTSENVTNTIPEGPPLYTQKTEKVNAGLVIALSISVLLNAILIIGLVVSRKKNKLDYDQSPDRTDFEIEFEK